MIKGFPIGATRALISAKEINGDKDKSELNNYKEYCVILHKG